MSDNPTRSNRSDIANTDWQMTAFDHDPTISVDFQQALVRILGIDTVNNIWRSVPVDNQGRLYVTTQQVAGGIPSISNTTFADTSEHVLLSANTSRRKYTLINTGTASISFYFISASSAKIALTPGSTFTDDLYTGPLYGLSSATGATLTVIEY